VNTWDQDRSAHIVENETRNECVIKLANDFSKRNIQTLILVQLIKHGKDLEKRIPNSVFIYGGSSKKKREQALEDIQSGKLKILIGSTIADEGLDIPALSALILAGGGKSPTRAKQRVGRVIRKGSSQALVYDFIDDGKWSYDHSKERLKILKEEPEFDVKVISVKDVLSPYKDLF
ncbi:MAG TPA: helicase-related protein, partial [Bacillota bacterium]|nr:helicase-related protein [Bacillota bacterium]